MSEAFSLDLAGFALVGLDCNLCQLTLFWAHTLKMEVFFDGFAAAAHRAGDLSIAGHGSVVTPA